MLSGAKADLINAVGYFKNNYFPLELCPILLKSSTGNAQLS
jgi:hypothetical protein